MSKADDSLAFMDALTKSPQMKVLSVMAEQPQAELTKTEIAQKAGIGRTTLYRVWNELERMKAITPSRQVGAVTLYRLNPQSPAVQSLMNITKSLTTVTSAVSKIEEIRQVERAAKEQFGREIPVSPSVLVKLTERGAVDAQHGIDYKGIGLASEERDSVDTLLKAGLVGKAGDRIFLTPLGVISARGAAKIWKTAERETIDEALASAKVALDLINQEIRKLRGKQAK